MTQKIAQTVTCRTSEYSLEVDGHPFPWHINTVGPRFTRLLDDLYRVDVTIYGALNDPDPKTEHAEFWDTYESVTIGGKKFPWAITAEGFTYHRSRHTPAAVRLGFLAKTVDTDGEILDLRRVGKTDQPVLRLDGIVYEVSA